jgi:hypothetical protein
VIPLHFQYPLRWLVFFLICAGLGYPTLQRYDPRTTGGITDAQEYYDLASSTDLFTAKSILSEEDPRPRLLVPLTARLVRGVVAGHSAAVDSGLLSLLIANALFCATTALLLTIAGKMVTGDDASALTAALLYLLSFAVSNYYLTALVDSGEACLLLALAWALMSERWQLLPLIGIAGVLAKETFMPFAAIYSTVWYWRVAGFRLTDCRGKWWFALNVSTFGTLLVLWSSWYRQPVLPWTIAVVQHGLESSFWTGLWGAVANHGTLYLFGWLLPLGVWKLHRLPPAWVLPCIATVVGALLMGAWDDSGSNIARALFNICGPVLALSTALLLTGSAKQPHALR